MQGKKTEESALVMSHIMQPGDANPAGNVHGGVIMYYIDTTAGAAGMRHARMPVVTASIDRLDLRQPVYVGEMATFMASVNYVGRTSMEVGVRVIAENLLNGELRRVASAYLTMVALDDKGRPTAVPPVILSNETERRRNREAAARRENRLAERQRESEDRASGN